MQHLYRNVAQAGAEFCQNFALREILKIALLENPTSMRSTFSSWKLCKLRHLKKWLISKEFNLKM